MSNNVNNGGQNAAENNELGESVFVNENAVAPDRTEAAVTRRHFLAGVGGVGIVAMLIGGGASAVMLNDDVYAVETSGGYLLVDTKKCAGCETCMMVCSLAHNGQVNRSLARIQISKNPLGCYPREIAQNQCRQCAEPGCVAACPTGAMHVDEETGVRMVDEGKCIGCESCVAGCLYTPSRVQWNFEGKHAQKCDLCKNTPYWDKEGGADGCQACATMCPVSAIKFTKELPTQDDDGYIVNLRNEHWAHIGFPVDDEGMVFPYISVPPDPSVIAPEGEEAW